MKKYLLAAFAFCAMFTANAQWQEQNAGFTKDTLGFYEMSVPDKNVAWAICYDGKFGLFSNRLVLDFTRTTNGGATWVPGKMGTDTTLAFSNISAIDDQTAWVAMHKRFGITGGGLYFTNDGGVTWAQSSPGEIFDENSFPNVVHFKDKNHGFAIGDPNNGYFEIYTTNNGGKKWKRVPASNIPAPQVNEFGFISGYYVVGNTIWFGTSTGRMYKSTNFGKDWTVNTVDPLGRIVFEIAFNDDQLRGVTHVRNNFGQTFLFSTTDGGLTWTNLGQPLNWKRSRITAVPGTDALISTSVFFFDPGSSISYDNGVTWTELERTRQKAVARFLDANTGYAGGFFVTGPPFLGGIYKSQIEFEQPENKHVRSGARQEQQSVETDVKVYPTPANNVINVILPESMINTTSVISILAADGKLISTMRSTGAKSVQVNVGKIPNGFYTLQIRSSVHTINRAVSISR